jgi:hypothetical protein
MNVDSFPPYVKQLFQNKELTSSGVKKIYYNTDYKNDPVVKELGYEIDLKKTL